MQLEVLETEFLFLPRLAGGIAQALQIGNPKFDMDALPQVSQQAYDSVLNGLPYVAGPGGEQSVVERERAGLIKRARERRDRLLEGRADTQPEEPKLKPTLVGKEHGRRD
jgi:hypothetical protein